VNITGSRFDLELKSVIFSHVNEADKIGAQSLDELLEFKTAPIKERIVQLRAELSALNAKLVALQQEASPEQKQLILNLIATKERELEAHDKIKPVDVPKPEADPVTKAEMDTISALITQKNLERDKASQRIRDAEAAKRVAALRSAVADRILSTISNFEAHFETFLANLSNDCLEIGIDPAQLVRFESNVEPVQTELALAKKLSVDKDAEIGILNTRLASLKDEIANLSVKLDSPNREYQTFVEALREWNAKRAEIVGDEESADTITYLNNRVTHLAELPAMIADTKVRRETKVREIYHSIETLVAIYKSLYLPVQGFIGQHALSQDNFRLNFDARIISSELEMKFSERINQGRKGSFCGLDEGKKILRHLVESTDFQKEDAAIEFCSLLLDHLTYDHRYSPKVPATVTEQLKSGTNEQQLLDFIFGLEYLVPKYQLQWSGKDLDELSPGERGTLLLVFYLLIDKRDIPLVIDQPEENLDNQTVYNVLVPCLREARERRQVIIVTHNPNLAIVCDADQVIHCHMDKKNRNKVTYTSGAIENPAINRLTIDVLEGTRPAFDRRDSKYQTEPVVAAHKAAP
jgi:hypothetical protein